MLPHIRVYLKIAEQFVDVLLVNNSTIKDNDVSIIYNINYFTIILSHSNCSNKKKQTVNAFFHV